MEVVIGVDGGTTAVKAVAFALDGQIVATHHEAVPVVYGAAGEAEQDMNQIWHAVVACLKSVVEQIGQATILGIGLTGQGDGAWLIDAEGEPVGPAANWLDGRSAERVHAWEKEGKDAKVLEVTGTTIFPGLFPILIEELAVNNPERIAKAATHLNCKDFLRFKLTGERITDYTEASRSFLDVRTGDGFSVELAEDLGLAEFTRLLPEIHGAADPGIPLSLEAAELTGIPAGTPVGIGMIDVAVTGMGLGTYRNGDSWLILGTTGFVGTFLPSVEERKSDNSMVLATGVGRQVLEFLPPMTGTPNLDWIRRILGLEGVEWSDIENLARESGPGAHGVVYLPYAAPGGERAPFLDTNASASWKGMSLTTTPGDLLRSVYEGVAFSLVECVETLQLDGELVVSGGGFRSDLICEILADSTGLPVVRQDAPEAGARGAAVLALVSAGKFETVAEAAAALGTEMERFEPNPEQKAIYEESFRVLKEARNAIQPVWKEMRGLRKLAAKSDEGMK